MFLERKYIFIRIELSLFKSNPLIDIFSNSAIRRNLNADIGKEPAKANAHSLPLIRPEQRGPDQLVDGGLAPARPAALPGGFPGAQS